MFILCLRSLFLYALEYVVAGLVPRMTTNWTSEFILQTSTLYLLDKSWQERLKL